jgi:hypothetical protein
MTQIWMGKFKIAVGSMVGHELYKTVWRLLDKNCRPTEKWGMCRFFARFSVVFLVN